MTASRLVMIGIIAYLGVAHATPAQAERPSAGNPFQYIAGLGPIVFNRGGGAFLPLSVLQSLAQNSVSPIQQFVLVNNLMTKCTKDVIEKNTPNIRDPYVVAKAKFEYGLCRIKKCFQQGMLILVLPELQSSSSNNQDGSGGSSTGAILAQAFQKDGGCDGKGGDGLDPAVLALLTKH